MLDLIYILGIVGSPRRNGNTELLVSEALRVVEEKGVKTELLRLAGKEIKPCDACLSCKKTGECHIKDDFVEYKNLNVSLLEDENDEILTPPVYLQTENGGSVYLLTKKKIHIFK